MKLYSIPFCPFCLRVKLMLNNRASSVHKIQIEEVDLKNPPIELKKINPNITVPTLQLENGDGFAESLIIMEYLDKMDSIENKVFGNSNEETAKIKFLIERLTQEVTNILMENIFTFGSKMKFQKAIQKLPQAFEKLNILLKDINSPYFGGNILNAADISIAPFIAYYMTASNLNKKFTLPDSLSRAGKYFVRIKEHPEIQTLIFSDEKFNENAKKFILEPENITYIKNSSRNLIENIDLELNKLNTKITSNLKSNKSISWKLNKNEKGPFIETLFEFKNSEDTIAAIQKICDLQETSDHHANFTLENFGTLKIEVCTHQPKWGVTAMDFAFAETLTQIILN